MFVVVGHRVGRLVVSAKYQSINITSGGVSFKFRLQRAEPGNL